MAYVPRVIRSVIFRVLVGLVMALITAAYSWASFPPIAQWSLNGGSFSRSSAGASCAAYLAATKQSDPGTTTYAAVVVGPEIPGQPGTICRLTATGYSADAEMTGTATQSCVADALYAAGSCTCTAPKVQNAANNGCETPAGPTPDQQCQAIASLVMSTLRPTGGTEVNGAWQTGSYCWPYPSPSGGTVSCQVNWTASLVVKSATGAISTEGYDSFPPASDGTTGSTSYACAPPASAPPPPVGSPVRPPDKCVGGSEGQINGVTVCVPHGLGGSTTTTAKNASSAASSPQGDVITNSQSVTTCTGQGSCTTTTTTSVNGVPSTSSVTEAKGEYCAKNASAPECGRSADQSFSGTCKEGFKSQGDALLAAVAEATNKTLCALTPGVETQGVIDQLAAGTFGADLEVKNKTFSNFDQTNPLAAGCPSDFQISTQLGAVTVPLSSMCSFLQALGWIALLVTLIYSTLFVVRGL